MESMSNRTVYNTYVIDDGWNLPYEVIEEIDLRIANSRRMVYEEVLRQHAQHKGEWLTAEIACEYGAKAWVYRVLSGNQCIGKLREFGKELQERYGVTEIEAINILFERNVADYVNKYYRMQHLIPRRIDQQEICDTVAQEYLAAVG